MANLTGKIKIQKPLIYNLQAPDNAYVKNINDYVFKPEISDGEKETEKYKNGDSNIFLFFRKHRRI